MRRRNHLQAFSLFSFQDIITSVTGILILLTLFLALQLVQPKPSGAAADDRAKQAELERSIQQVDEQINELRDSLSSGQESLNDFVSLSPESLEQEKEMLKRTIDRLHADIKRLQSDVDVAQLSNSNLRVETDELQAVDTIAALQAQVESLRKQLESLKAANRVVYNAAPDVTKTAWLIDLSDRKITVTKPGSKDLPREFVDKVDSRGVDKLLVWAGGRQRASDYFVLLVRPKSLSVYREVYERLNDLKFAIGVDLLEGDATLIDISDISTVPP